MKQQIDISQDRTLEVIDIETSRIEATRVFSGLVELGFMTAEYVRTNDSILIVLYNRVIIFIRFMFVRKAR